MKKLIFLAIISLVVWSCQKSQTKPSNPGSTKPDSTTACGCKHDTIPDTGLFKVQLIKDSTIKSGTDETLIVFRHDYKANYNLLYSDAAAPSWNASLSILSLTSDGIACIEHGLPYTPGVTIPLFIEAANGSYILKAYSLKKIPSDIHIWCRDNYLKDSLDMYKGNYHFDVDNADTASFGKRRFQIVMKPQ